MVLTLSLVGCKPKVECNPQTPSSDGALSFIAPKPEQALCLYKVNKAVSPDITKYETSWDIEGSIETVLAGSMASLVDWKPSGKAATPEARPDSDSKSANVQMEKGNQHLTLILTQPKPSFLSRPYTSVHLMMTVRN